MIPGFKLKRITIDTVIVLSVALTGYITGFIQSLEIGPATFIFLLPNFFIMVLGYTHIVLRKGRKYDTFEHTPRYEAFKTGLFTIIVWTGYTTGLTSQSLNTALMAITVLAGLYVFVYRPHR